MPAGRRSLSARRVAKRLVDEVRAYQRSTGALGPHLADQWICRWPWRCGAAGRLPPTCSVTPHTATNAQTIAMGLPVRVQITPAAGAMRVEVSPPAVTGAAAPPTLAISIWPEQADKWFKMRPQTFRR